MKYITINPGFDQHLNLEPGEEYKLTMDVPIYNGGEVVRTTVNIKIPAAPEVPKIKETIFTCVEGGCIPAAYIPNSATFVNLKNVKFDQLHNAIATAEHLQLVIKKLGKVSIAQLRTYLGYQHSTDNDRKHGWSSPGAFIVTVEPDGAELHVPPAHYFGEPKLSKILDDVKIENINDVIGSIIKQLEKDFGISLGSESDTADKFIKITCPHCGFEYNPSEDMHSVVKKTFPRLGFDDQSIDCYYDAWNCPLCGGQYVGAERFPEIK